jgi:hypothetical protein
MRRASVTLVRFNPELPPKLEDIINRESRAEEEHKLRYPQAAEVLPRGAGVGHMLNHPRHDHGSPESAEMNVI